MQAQTSVRQFTVRHAIADVWQVVIEHRVGVGGYRTETEVISTHVGRKAAEDECARRTRANAQPSYSRRYIR